MKHIELLKNRYSVRKFKNMEVSDAEIKDILEAANVSPTAKNLQPQRILVINSKEALLSLKECTRCHYDAPLAFLICYDKEADWLRPYDSKRSGEIDSSIVTTNMMNEASSIGISSTWVMHFNPFKMREYFSIPDNYEITALLVMGYESEENKISDLHYEFDKEENMVFYNKF